MFPSPQRLIILAALLIATPGISRAAYRGYVEPPWSPTPCLQESHFLTDPCTGQPMWLLDDRGVIDMDPYLCKYVDVNGPNVGVECLVVAPTSVLPAQPPCSIIFTEMWMGTETPPNLHWDHITCAAAYDVIRGNLPGPVAAGSLIDLGSVDCLANDVPQPLWWNVKGPADFESPRAGSAYFYLVRATGMPDGDTNYGYSSDNQVEVPLFGDCPL